MNEQTYLVFENNLKIIPILFDFNSLKIQRNSSSINSVDPLNIVVDIIDYHILYDEFLKSYKENHVQKSSIIIVNGNSIYRFFGCFISTLNINTKANVIISVDGYDSSAGFLEKGGLLVDIQNRIKAIERSKKLSLLGI